MTQSNEILPEGFHSCAEWVVTVFAEEFNSTLTYDAAGVEAVATYIEEIRPLVSGKAKSDAIAMLGAFLGECIIRNCGGQWSLQAGWWGVELSKEVIACPFVQVENQLTTDKTQSISRYFRCLQELSHWLCTQQSEVASVPVLRLYEAA